ncbi:MAG TPA: peptide ABC transporter substrate-binding protein, partial [Micropepsaceae bacterium]|nr:peptide ABC transporter substrate-binding protein [Micropepsaceae bacterium]
MPQMLDRRAFLASASSATLLIVAGCGQPNSASNTKGGVPNQTPGVTVLNRGNGAEPKSLDPHHSEGTWEVNVIGELIVGLTTEDAEAKPIAGAAESWETSPDGKTWTFHLRDHQWSDGQPVTAEDFIYAWQRILNPKTAAQYASLLYIFKNAEPINAGKMPPTALGAKATDPKTLVLELEHPAPYMLELMTHQTTYPVPYHKVEALGDAWTKAGDYVCNGPYRLTEWVPNDHITIEKNPKFYDAANVKIDRVVFYPTTDADAALKRFRAGELDVQDPLPASQIDWLRQNLPDVLQINPYLGIGYIVCNQKRKPFDDVRVREALNLAYDRETVSDKILRLGEPPAYSFVPAGIANYPDGNVFDFKPLPYPERIKRGQELMKQAGFSDQNRLKTTYAISTAPDARRVAAAAQQMWKQIYVDIEIVPSEVQVNYLKLQNGDYDIGGAGWIADYNDARNFLFLLMTN